MLTCIKLYSSHIHTKQGTEFEFVLLICNQNSIRIYGSICSEVDSVSNLTLSFVYALFCLLPERERERERVVKTFYHGFLFSQFLQRLNFTLEAVRLMCAIRDMMSSNQQCTAQVLSSLHVTIMDILRRENEKQVSMLKGKNTLQFVLKCLFLKRTYTRFNLMSRMVNKDVYNAFFKI